MAREIKFRRAHFKDKEKTQFSHVDEWGVNVRVGNHIANFVNPSSNNLALYFTDYQFTGLKDKNGKEIYEGDIIELVNEDKETIRVVCEYGIARRSVLTGGLGVEVDIPCFYFRLPNGKKSFPIVKNYANKHDLELFEIVGNIYEAPESILPPD